MKKYSLVKICLLALCSAMFLGVLTPTASAATFTDVSAHWAASYIETCANLGIVDGVGGGRFEPEGKVTNAQFVKMLCAAFYSSEEELFENENRSAINVYFGGSTQWYSGKSYYFEKMGLLTNVDYNIQSSASANQSMNRNNMAQVAANVLAQKGIAADKGDKALAQASLSLVNDYYTIPEDNRDAVKTCYALGIITGMDGGKFNGENTMTRAQACTVITRLLDVVKTGPVTTTPFDPIETPEPTVKDIVVTSNTNASTTNIGYGATSGTSYNITDNGIGNGYLANGKPINEANITELLTKAKTLWPTGMTWTDSGTNNNWYQAPSLTVTNMLNRSTTGATQNISARFGCGGFAAMISDYLFGKNNPGHIVTKFEDIRPGDIIVQIDSNKVARHVMIVTGINQTDSRTGYVFCADGNRSNVISWSGTSAWDSWSPTELGAYGSYVAISRWP